MKGILVFGGSGPLLLLGSYPTIDDPELIERLHAKGLEKFIAYEIPIDRCRELYGHATGISRGTSGRLTTCGCSTSTATTSS